MAHFPLIDIISENVRINSKTVPNFLLAECRCAGKSNMWGEGSKCRWYNNHEDNWYNGLWCYADVETCSDAKAHPALESHNVHGYGASRAACPIGIYKYDIRTLITIWNCLEIWT